MPTVEEGIQAQLRNIERPMAAEADRELESWLRAACDAAG
jgi:hypothetical protein